MMTIRKCGILCWLTISLMVSMIPIAAADMSGQTIQINTNFRSITGKPVWLLILRDTDTGVVKPYIYDIRTNNNSWLVMSPGNHYIITASTLKFGPFAITHNFCHLEDSALAGKSMSINITGDLTPSSKTYKCRILKYF